MSSEIALETCDRGEVKRMQLLRLLFHFNYSNVHLLYRFFSFCFLRAQRHCRLVHCNKTATIEEFDNNQMVYVRREAAEEMAALSDTKRRRSRSLPNDRPLVFTQSPKRVKYDADIGYARSLTDT